MITIDSEFPRKFPFGILKTAQWVCSLAIIIVIFASPYMYGGVGFVLFCAWTLFIASLLSWLAHLFNFQRRTFMIGQSAAFIPFALLDFIHSLLFFFLFSISTLICFVCMLVSITYAGSVFFSYLIMTALCAITVIDCGYLAMNLYKAAPNGLMLNLRSVIIEGDKTSIFDVRSNVDTGIQTPSAYPQGTNPV